MIRFKIAYLDTSYLVAIAFDEPGSDKLVQFIRTLNSVYAASLLEAEFLAAAEREGLRDKAYRLLDGISWVHPGRRLTEEINEVLTQGYLCEADLFHLATAKFLFPDPTSAYFLSLDKRQLEIASSLGFQKPD